MNTQCWSCKKNFDTTTSVRGVHSPEEGDVSICFYCAEIAIFTGRGMEQRKPTENEREIVEQNPVVKAVVEKLKAKV